MTAGHIGPVQAKNFPVPFWQIGAIDQTLAYLKIPVYFYNKKLAEVPRKFDRNAIGLLERRYGLHFDEIIPQAPILSLCIILVKFNAVSDRSV